MLSLTLALSLLMAAPKVAVVLTAPGAEASTLHLVALGATEVPASVASVTHLPDAEVKGVLLPGSTTALVVTQVERRADASWSGALFRLEPGKPAQPLLTELAAWSRPVLVGSRVFVSRGEAGPPQSPRVDALFIDEVNPQTGATMRRFTGHGSLAYLAGAVGHELIVSLIAPAGSSLLAVDVDTGVTRTLAAGLNGMARDFTVDEGRLAFTTFEAGAWVVQRLDLRTLERRTVAKSARPALFPVWLPSGLSWVPGPGEGLFKMESEGRSMRAHGPGYEHVRFVQGAIALGLHEVPSAFAVPFAFDLERGVDLGLPTLPGVRTELVGVAP
jgi:hypothetical protein